MVCGPYERAHALALAEEIVADEELMAVVEPLLPLVDVEQIRGDIAGDRPAAGRGGGRGRRRPGHRPRSSTSEDLDDLEDETTMTRRRGRRGARCHWPTPQPRRGPGRLRPDRRQARRHRVTPTPDRADRRPEPSSRAAVSASRDQLAGEPGRRVRWQGPVEQRPAGQRRVGRHVIAVGAEVRPRSAARRRARSPARRRRPARQVSGPLNRRAAGAARRGTATGSSRVAVLRVDASAPPSRPGCGSQAAPGAGSRTAAGRPTTAAAPGSRRGPGRCRRSGATPGPARASSGRSRTSGRPSSSPW